MENGTEALKDYPLPPEAKAAIMPGGRIWLRDIAGESRRTANMLLVKL